MACHDVDSVSTGCLFADNVCAGAGGGAYWTYSDGVTLTAADFEGNAALAGGGLFVEDATAPELVDCVFAVNEATTHGGALVCYHNPPLTGCSFEGNTAGGFGGALFLGGSPTLTACSLRDNAADKGGALACLGMQGAGVLTLMECVLDGNEAGFQGGAVWLGPSDGAVHLAAEDTDFGRGAAPIGATGFLQEGCTAFLHCCTTEPGTWVGGGVTVDDTDCGIAAEPASWGRLKALYGD
jgi:hypothetical protein